MLSLAANTSEVLWLVNRSGNRPSHEGAAAAVDRVVAVCRQGGFRKVLLRGDTDSLCRAPSIRWDADGSQFLFGFDAAPNLKTIAEAFEQAAAWRFRRRRGQPTTSSRCGRGQRPDNVKEAIVQEREFENRRLLAEQVARVRLSADGLWAEAYRMIVVRKNISVAMGRVRAVR